MTKALGLAKRLQQSRHVQKNLEQAIILGASSFFTRVLPLPLAFFAIILRRRLELKLTERDRKKKKTCCNAIHFPENLELLSQTLGGAVVSLVCCFIRRDSLLAW